MRKQAGFTLIELIMVIVILGILSAFALPRFANLTDSAERAALEGARGSVTSASAIVHAASLVAGNSSAATATVAIEGGTANLVFGYPAVGDATNFNIEDVAQIGDFDITTTPATATVLTVTSGACSFTYTEAANATTPPVISAITGC